jgi:hypothetical protein
LVPTSPRSTILKPRWPRSAANSVQIDMAMPVKPKGAFPARRFCKVDDKHTTARLQNAEGFSADFLMAPLWQMVEHQGAEDDIKFSSLERQFLSGRGRETDLQPGSPGLRSDIRRPPAYKSDGTLPFTPPFAITASSVTVKSPNPALRNTLLGQALRVFQAVSPVFGFAEDGASWQMRRP